MKQIFLKKENNRKLILFFAGWGADQNLFNMPVAKGYDYLLCFDYKVLDFDYNSIAEYESIRLIAWSMGVWAASMTFMDKEFNWENKIAINGTMTPVNDTEGIPTAVFKGTLEGFSAVTLAKFRRRMCGNAEGVKTFLAHTPCRSLEDLHEELAEVYKQVTSEAPPIFKWDLAVISTNDKIFPANNLRNAWKNTETYEVESEHYDEKLFSACISEEEVIWTSNS